MYLRYVGGSDVRELSKADFEKIGIDSPKETFHASEVYEFDDEAGQLLLDSAIVRGEFAEVPAVEVEGEPDEEDDGLTDEERAAREEETKNPPGPVGDEPTTTGGGGGAGATGASGASGATATGSRSGRGTAR